MHKVAAVALVGMLLIMGCRTDMTPSEAGSSGSARRVLIVGETTAFKQKVVTRAIEKLGTREWYFRIIGLSSLAGQETSSYGAILLVTSFQAGRIDERVTRFLAADPTNPKAIVFYTRGTDDPMPERSKPDLRVDAISSASRDDRVETRADELVALLMKRF